LRFVGVPLAAVRRRIRRESIVTDPLLERVKETIAEVMGSLVSPPWHKVDDGGVSETPEIESDVWSTAEIMMLAGRFLELGMAFPGLVVEPARTVMKDHLLKAWREDGSWPTALKDRENGGGDIVATSLSLLALWGFNPDPSENEEIVRKVRTSIEWLAEVANEGDGWSVMHTPERPTGSTAFPTIVAYQAIWAWRNSRGIGSIGLAMNVAYGATDWLETVRVGPAIKESVKKNSPSARHTSYLVLAHKAVGGLGVSDTETLQWLREAQNHENGMWSYQGNDDIEATAASVRALLVLGVDPFDGTITSGVEALLGLIRERAGSAGRVYSGWTTTEDSLPRSFLNYYALMALLDFFAARRNRPPAPPTPPVAPARPGRFFRRRSAS
jgi:hypothetical protein